MNKTKIEWVKNPDGTQGYTWNPITGCLNGCPYCYARRLANGRLRERYLANHNVCVEPLSSKWATAVNDPFYPRFWPERCNRAGQVMGKPKGIFVCDMSDLFGISIPEEWTRKVLDICRAMVWNRYYLLTKQPQSLIKWSPFPPNCYVGVTAANYDQYIKALMGLIKIEAKVKYISFEPLLEHIVPQTYAFSNHGIDWVIIGAQTKPTVYPRIEWVEETVNAADRAGIPVFLKDNLTPALEVRKPFIGKGASYRQYPRQEMPK